MSKPIVFISYSHKDEEWKDLLMPHLRMMEQLGEFEVWDDRRIDVGATWYPEIRQAMERAKVAVCLISADFLASDFCVKEEVPFLLERRSRDNLVLIPVLLRPCQWERVPWLKRLQMLPRDGKSVAVEHRDTPDNVFSEVTGVVATSVEESASRAASALSGFDTPLATTEYSELAEAFIDIDRLPQTGQELFGRQDEMQMLDEAWESSETSVLSLVAWGGVGKSTLVNKWLEGLAADNYRGARRIFGWSFYSQGTGERVTSADAFFDEALRWFGEDDPARLSLWQKGPRLAELIRRQRTLLVLDGMEPLQSGLEFQRGKIEDPALEMLIAGLARESNGLCLITTREKITGLPQDVTLKQRDLEQISAAAARALLRVADVRGTDRELESAGREFGFQALAVRLLASYLYELPGHPVAPAFGIADIGVPPERGKHPRRVIAAFEKRLGEGPALQVLRVLGLFNRPAKAEELEAVMQEPAIEGLTDRLQGLRGGQRERTLERLRAYRLIARKSRHRPEDLDAHPVVREHMAARLRDDCPEAWREGHRRLYVHLKDSAKEHPGTLEGLLPLYQAVGHGCLAGLEQEALDDVLYPRIRRHNEHFSTKKLGAYGADLGALAGFFEGSWDRPSAGLSAPAQAFVLGSAGYCLRALGRLGEALAPIGAGLEARLAQEDWKNAAVVSSNLSLLHMVLGDLQESERLAREGVNLADRSGDAFERMARRTDLAAVLHQRGGLEAAGSLFAESESMQKEDEPEYPLLYSLRGYYYCDLLLESSEAAALGGGGRADEGADEALGRCGEVRDRAVKGLEVASRNQWLRDIALDRLTLGRTLLLEWLLRCGEASGAEDRLLHEAGDHLRQAVEGLREAGEHDHIPRGHIARAQWFRAKGDFEEAESDLAEAESIANRGPMRLLQADIRLERARLALAMGKPQEARDQLGKAKALIEETGYHRRDVAVEALEKQLAV